MSRQGQAITPRCLYNWGTFTHVTKMLLVQSYEGGKKDNAKWSYKVYYKFSQFIQVIQARYV